MSDSPSSPPQLPLPADGAAAPPRTNGELVFEAPWEGRLFGVTLHLVESGRFAWSSFQNELISAIAENDQVSDSARRSYYECWQIALERLLASSGLLPDGEIAHRSAELATRPHGHDHH